MGVVAVALAACRLTAVPMRESISPPPTLSMQEVEAGILQALAPPSLWTLDAREPATVYATRIEGTQALRVAIDYSTYRVTLRIVAARDLDFTGVRIDRRALEWVDQLDEQVRVGLGARSETAAHHW